ncbi:hypothetical protein [Streptomyces tricolor]
MTTWVRSSYAHTSGIIAGGTGRPMRAVRLKMWPLALQLLSVRQP